MRVTIDTKSLRACSRKGCTNSAPYFRHHLGNDGLLAAWGFFWARKTYHRYYSTREVCDSCHMACHYLYEQLLPLNSWGERPRNLKQIHKWFEALRNRYIQIGKRFLDGKIPYPDIPADYREKWQRSQSIWKMRRSATGQPVKSVKPVNLNPHRIRFDHE